MGTSVRNTVDDLLGQSPNSIDALFDPPAKRPPLLRRVASAAKEMVLHPVETAKGIVMAPIEAASTGIDFIGQTVAEQSLPDDVRANYIRSNDPERISERDALIAAGQLASVGAGRFLGKIPKIGIPVAAATAGAAFSPDDPAVGAIVAGAAGTAGAAAGKAISKRAEAATTRNLIAKADAIFQQAQESNRAKIARGEEIVGPTTRVPAAQVPQRLATAGLARQDVPLPEHIAQSEPTPVIGEPVTFGRLDTTRRPGGAVDIAKLAKPMPEGTPIATAETRAVVNTVDSILEHSRVPVKEAAPATAEAFPDGFSTKSTATTRRPQIAGEPAPVNTVDTILAPEATPSAPEAVPRIAEPVSVGRDLNEPGRIPSDAPVVPPARGVEPSGVVQTAEGAVSVGEPALPEVPPVARVAPVVEPVAAPVVEAPKPPPSPRDAPREYLNYAKFGLDRTTEARLRDTVEGLRESGQAAKGFKSFAEQQAEASAFAKEFVQNPLDIDRQKLGKLTGAEIVGLRQVAAENTKMIEGLSQSIESGHLNADELRQANTMLDQAVASTNDVLGKIVRETAQTGRDLGFLRQVAKLTTDPDVWIVRAKKLLGDRPMTDVMMVEIRKLAREAAEACG